MLTPTTPTPTPRRSLVRRIRRIAPILCAALGILPAVTPGSAHAQDTRPRLLITTDIGGDPDDQQSLVRLLAHADAFRIEGLIASASGVPGETDPTPRTDLIQNFVNAYGQDHANLLQHSADFPTAASLLAKIHAGNPNRGISNVGVGNSTAGSTAIIAAVDASADPLNVAIWGGATELAQALFDVSNNRTPGEVTAFVNKLSVHAINDQDGYSDAAEGTLTWIKQNYPTLQIIDPTPQGAAPDDTVRRFDSTYRGFYQNDSATFTDVAVPLVSDDVALLNTTAWAQTNVTTNHGALGAMYPDTVTQIPSATQNATAARNSAGVKEGDTPAWLFYFPTGLNDPNRPDTGGWGGRYVLEGDGTNHFVPAFDELPEPVTDPAANVSAAQAKWTIARFREAYQNEFAARMDWFVEDFADANHAPIPLAGFGEPQTVRTDPDSFVFLLSNGWFDPDGQSLDYTWWFYEEAGNGTLPQAALDTLATTSSDSLFLSTADFDPGSTLHLILEVTDTHPDTPITRYERFIVRVNGTVIPEPAAATTLLALTSARVRRR